MLLVGPWRTAWHGGELQPKLQASMRPSRACGVCAWLPPEPVCLERVRSRADHGFRDQQAARHMYQQFATAAVDPRYVVTSTDAAAVLARQLFDLVHEGQLRWPAHDARIRARQPSDP